MIEGNEDAVIIEKHSVDEGINEPLAMFLLCDVVLCHSFKPKDQLLFRQLWTFEVFLFNLVFQYFSAFFQFIQTIFGGIGDDTRLQGI